MQDRVYRQRAGRGRWEYWTYSENRRVAMSANVVNRWLKAGTAKLITVN